MDDFRKGSREWGSKARKEENPKCRAKLKRELPRLQVAAEDTLAEEAAYAPCAAYPDCETCGDALPTPTPEKQIQIDAFAEAVHDEVARHHAAGRPVPVMRDGKLVWIGPGGKIVPAPE